MVKCISLWQPWATLWVSGEKIGETRSWYTAHRGPLVVHAAKKWNRELGRAATSEPFKSALGRLGLDPTWLKCANTSPTARKMMGLGMLVGIVNIVDCVQITEENCPDGNEREFGDYRLGRFRWIAEKPRMFSDPVPWRGSQGIFNIPDGILKAG